jgi:hypothetical protein
MTQEPAELTDWTGHSAGADGIPLLSHSSLVDVSAESIFELETLLRVLLQGVRRLTRGPRAMPSFAARVEALGQDVAALSRTAEVWAASSPDDKTRELLHNTARRLAAITDDLAGKGSR